MALDMLSDPFQEEASSSLSGEEVRQIAPSMPDTKLQSLVRASSQESWTKQEGVNEKFILDRELASIASYTSAELGPFVLDTYEQAQPVINAGVLRLTNSGDRTGSFRGENARGSSQWDISQLDVAALNPDVTDPSQYRVYEALAGNFNIAPALTSGGTEHRDPANDGSGVGSQGDGTHQLDTDTQAAFILGFSSSTNPRVVSQAKVGVDDGESRTAFDVYHSQTVGTLQTQDTPSLEYITDDDSFDINGVGTDAATTDLYPFGVNVNTADQLLDAGTKA
jgi:hypothetical protein